MENRAGFFMLQPTGYTSFIPKKLPPEPGIRYDNELWKLLSDADRKLGRLDGITQILPNPDLFVAMYVKKEAVLSSQIEGTQASLTDILNADIVSKKSFDICEVVNYVNAMEYGLNRLKEFPLCLRLIREIHEKLLEKGRGSNRNPGEFRTSQNWIGPAGCTLVNATFIPPTVNDMQEALSDLEKFICEEEDDIPSLIKIALIHAQFETIHPFLDGNGRVGRLLITFWLCTKKILTEPLLYLSYYFKSNRIEYYDRLMAIRKKGDWEGWIKFFLRGVSFVADEAIESAKSIIGLKEQYNNILRNNNTHCINLLDKLFTNPFVTKNRVAELLGISYPTASGIVEEFIALEILKDITPGQQRNKKYCFIEYVSILNRGTEIEDV
jgi:Fic family protein